MHSIGNKIHNLATELYPICRSITGPGVRETLRIIRREIGELDLQEVPSGTPCFDWTVPPEWIIRDAYIITPEGKKIADFNVTNLHVVGYSEPVNRTVSRDELFDHLHTLPELPRAVPYMTSYYKRTWGFCLSHQELESLPEGEYEVFIDSEFRHDGSLTYGELILAGESDDEVLISTYVCHPSLGNNELSGPCVTTFIARWLMERRRKKTYRIVFIPETIGSLCYLSRNLERMKARTIAGFNVSCVGDDRCYSFMPSRAGDTLSDRAARHILKHLDPEYRSYSYLARGSDERQYCWPGIDLPVASIMRSKYNEYPEYHTSLDNLELITPTGLEGGYEAIRRAIECIEYNCIPRARTLGEPMLGPRGLFDSQKSARNPSAFVNNILNLLTYSDGRKDLLEIADIIQVPFAEALELMGILEEHELVTADD